MTQQAITTTDLIKFLRSKHPQFRYVRGKRQAIEFILDNQPVLVFDKLSDLNLAELDKKLIDCAVPESTIQIRMKNLSKQIKLCREYWDLKTDMLRANPDLFNDLDFLNSRSQEWGTYEESLATLKELHQQREVLQKLIGEA